MISPKTRASEIDRPPSPAQVIRLFQERMEGWILEPTRAMLPNPDAGHAILSTLSAYFELVGTYLEDKASPYEKRAERGLDDVFEGRLPLGTATAYREAVRHGLYHTGLTKGDVVLWSEVENIDLRDGFLYVNPVGVFRAIEGHVGRLIARLDANKGDAVVARMIALEEQSLREADERIRGRIGGKEYFRTKAAFERSNPVAGGPEVIEGPLPTGDFSHMYWRRVRPDNAE